MMDITQSIIVTVGTEKAGKKDIYDSDFDGRSDKEWQKELENGVALENILQHLFD